MSDVTIEFKFKVDGAFADPTSVVLSDPTGTFGVKRNDTGAVVVADGTAMTKVATGVYRHTFSAPAAGLTYTWFAEAVYAGATYHFEREFSEAGTGMTLETARTYVRQFARNVAGDTSVYSDADVDRAIKLSAEDFLRETRCVTDDDQVDITDGDPVIATWPTGFRFDRLIRAWIEGENRPDLELVDFAALRKARLDTAKTGRPTHLAFATIGAAECFPTPDDDYTLNVIWTPPLTTFTEGTATPQSVTLNIPEDLLRPVLIYGATAALQHTDPEHMYASKSWQLYLDHRERCRGLASIAPRLHYRTPEDVAGAADE